MTEEEANTKMCPFYCLIIATKRSGNFQPVDLMCKTSDCMMWRWYSDKTEGYCGLAGKGER